MRVEAVVFDMDGVVVDSETYWEGELEEILEAVVPDVDVDPRALVGINVHDQYERLAAEYDLALDRTGYVGLFDRRADEIYGEQAELMEGFDELVDAIGERDRTVGLVTSSLREWVATVFDRFHLDGRFDVVVTAADENVPGKPAPDLYELAAARLGVDPTELLVVEDSANGVAAARAAGAYVIAYAVGPSAELDHSGADEVARDPVDLRRRVLTRLEDAE